MRDSDAKFEAHGIKLYAVSYDDQETLREFSEAQGIPYPLRPDIDSAVIRQYGILNTEVSKDDTFRYGIPFPGVYVCDETGTIVSKFFRDSYRKRESPEELQTLPAEYPPTASEKAVTTASLPCVEVLPLGRQIHGRVGTAQHIAHEWLELPVAA